MWIISLSNPNSVLHDRDNRLVLTMSYRTHRMIEGVGWSHLLLICPKLKSQNNFVKFVLARCDKNLHYRLA